jgi:hypothetical protein
MVGVEAGQLLQHADQAVGVAGLLQVEAVCAADWPYEGPTSGDPPSGRRGGTHLARVGSTWVSPAQMRSASSIADAQTESNHMPGDESSTMARRESKHRGAVAATRRRKLEPPATISGSAPGSGWTPTGLPQAAPIADRCCRRVLHLGLGASGVRPSGSQGVAAVSGVPANGVAIGSHSGDPTAASDPATGR